MAYNPDLRMFRVQLLDDQTGLLLSNQTIGDSGTFGVDPFHGCWIQFDPAPNNYWLNEAAPIPQWLPYLTAFEFADYRTDVNDNSSIVFKYFVKLSAENLVNVDFDGEDKRPFILFRLLNNFQADFLTTTLYFHQSALQSRFRPADAIVKVLIVSGPNGGDGDGDQGNGLETLETTPKSEPQSPQPPTDSSSQSQSPTSTTTPPSASNATQPQPCPPPVTSSPDPSTTQSLHVDTGCNNKDPKKVDDDTLKVEMKDALKRKLDNNQEIDKKEEGMKEKKAKWIIFF